MKDASSSAPGRPSGSRSPEPPRVRLPLKPEPFDLAEWIREIVAAHQAEAKTGRIPLTIERLHDLPVRVLLDRARVEKILSELLSNALGRTGRGGVRVRASHSGESDLLTIEVEDDGPGITPEQRNHLFDANDPAGAPGIEPDSGAISGLALARQLARSMNGDVTALSGPGTGSLFRITLPSIFLPPGGSAKPSSRHPTPAPKWSALVGLRVLAVDDHESNRLLLEHILRRAGAEVVLAGDGFEALNLFDQQAFDAIVLDVLMPNLDGYETARELRRRPAGDRIPILMLTAFAAESDREKCLAAGANEYLTKPFNPDELIGALARLANREGRNVQELSPSADPELMQLREEFLQHNERLLAEFLSRNPERAELSVWVHNLAGSGGSFGYAALTDRARVIERMLDAGEGRENIRNQLQALLEMVRSARGNQVNSR